MDNIEYEEICKWMNQIEMVIEVWTEKIENLETEVKRVFKSLDIESRQDDE